MGKPDWNAEAKRAVNLVHDRLFEAHRGAVIWHQPTNTLLAFCNDGSPNEHIAFMRKKCDEAGIAIRGIAVNDIDDESDQPYSFVMLVESVDVERFVDWLWESWWKIRGAPDEAGGAFEQIQRPIAEARLGRFMTGLEHPFERE